MNKFSLDILIFQKKRFKFNLEKESKGVLEKQKKLF